MASTSSEPKIIAGVAQCRQVTRYLTFFSPVIGLHACGVDLSATGALTLLQVATPAGKVYLFDVKACKLMFDRGGLRDLLESQDIVKVVHSCRRLNEALYHQFDVTLTNVFDTQIAYLVLEKIKGKCFPRRVPLDDINLLYGGSPNQAKQGREFWKQFPAYWAQRPLADDMITYATGRVLALVPDPYETMKRLLAAHQLTDLFEERVHQELIRYIKPEEFFQHRNEKVRTVTMQVLSAMEAKYNYDTDPRQLTEDEKQALSYVRVDPGKSWNPSPLIVELKKKVAMAEIEDLEESFRTNPESFKLGLYGKRRLKHFTHHSDNDIKQKAITFDEKLETRKRKRILHKYQTGCPLSNEEKLYIVQNRTEMAGSDDTIVYSVVMEFEQKLRSKLDAITDPQKRLRQIGKYDRIFLTAIPIEVLKDDYIRDIYGKLQAEQTCDIREEVAISTVGSMEVSHNDQDYIAVDNLSDHDSH